MRAPLVIRRPPAVGSGLRGTGGEGDGRREWEREREL